MKKMLLLIVSGLLIACMAGSALAQFPQVTNDQGVPYNNENPTTLQPDTPTIMGLKLSNIEENERGNPYQIILEFKKAGPSGTFIDVPSSEATCELVTDPFNFIMPQSGDFISTQVARVTIKNGVPSSNEYRVTMHVGDKTGYIICSASEGARIPEFPTIALPVAALLGLVFVFGRKKGDL